LGPDFRRFEKMWMFLYHHPHKNGHFANHILPKLSAYNRRTRVAQMAMHSRSTFTSKKYFPCKILIGWLGVWPGQESTQTAHLCEEITIKKLMAFPIVVVRNPQAA
jgi:hypothetical protein